MRKKNPSSLAPEIQELSRELGVPVALVGSLASGASLNKAKGVHLILKEKDINTKTLQAMKEFSLKHGKIVDAYFFPIKEEIINNRLIVAGSKSMIDDIYTPKGFFKGAINITAPKRKK